MFKPITQAFTSGMRSLGEEAMQNYLIKNAVQQNLDDGVRQMVSKLSAEQVAQAWPQLMKDADDYLARFSQAMPAPTFDNAAEQFAYGAGRKVQGAKQIVGNTVQSMGGVPGVAMQAAFMYPMIAPMFQGQEEYR